MYHLKGSRNKKSALCYFKGADGPGASINEERTNNEDSSGSLVYNPHASLSIALQRQRLPIFKVSIFKKIILHILICRRWS